MGHFVGTPFGLGSTFNPLQTTGWGLSSYGSSLIQQPILQSLQAVAQQLHQLQQLNYVQQQQLQQLQQWIQIVPYQLQQQPLLQQSALGSPAPGLTGFAPPPIGASPLFTGQPGQVM
jgi:hypothetical protein